MKYGFTLVSRNAKTGPIPVATSHRDTCPTTCGLRGNGCYAEHGPLRLVWDRVSLTLEELCARIKSLPKRQMWRYAQAGDLPGDDDRICAASMRSLVAANRGRQVLAFTHKPPTDENLAILRDAQQSGFVVNLSADNMTQADRLADTGLPVVTVLASYYGRKRDESLGEYRKRRKEFDHHTPAGRRIAVCPASYAKTTCSTCGICANPDRRGVIVGFPAHGSKTKVIDRTLQLSTQHARRVNNRQHC